MRRPCRAFVLSCILLLIAAASAGAYTEKTADVDGDGISDTVDLFENSEGYGPADLMVTRGSNGEVLDVEYDYSPGGFTGQMLIVHELDRVAGSEIIIDAQHITTNELIEVYSMTGGFLHRAGRFRAFGGDSDYRFGITCKKSHKFTGVVQHNFRFSFKSRHWRRTNQRYKWKNGYLVRSGRASRSTLRGKPKHRETRVRC